MIKLENAQLCPLLPPNLQTDPKTRALGAAWDQEFARLVEFVQRVTMVFAFVPQLDTAMADHLCLSLDIKGYKADLPLSKKRQLIQSALLNYSRMGTKAALEDAVGIIHGGTTIQEAWEYGGKPYHFRAAVDASQEEVGEDPAGRLLDTILQYKNVRSWLDGLQVELVEEATLYGGAAPEMGLTLVVEPYRVRDMVAEPTAWLSAMAMHGASVVIGP